MMKKLLITSVLAGCMSVGWADEVIKGTVTLYEEDRSFTSAATMTVCASKAISGSGNLALYGKLKYSCNDSVRDTRLGVFTANSIEYFMIPKTGSNRLCQGDSPLSGMFQLQTDKKNRAFTGQIDMDHSGCDEQ